MMKTIRMNLETMKYERKVRMAKNKKQAVQAAKEGKAYKKGSTVPFEPLYQITPEHAGRKGMWMTVYIREN